MNDQFTEKAGSWDSVPWKNDLAEKAYRKIRENRNIKPDAHLVDIGGGTGLLTLKFVHDVEKITVIDTSASMLSVLREKIAHKNIENVNILEDYFGPATFEGNSIDTFISMMTLHHIPDIEDFFVSIHQALKPGGSLSFIDLETEPGDFHMEGTEYYHNGFAIEEVRKVLEHAGFKEIWINPTFNVTKKTMKGEMKTYPLLYIEGYK